MSNIPCLSIIMPAYNAAPYIAQAIYSILEQNFSSLELIVVDDGSSDQTAEIVRSIMSGDDRVKLLTQINSGKPSVARNKGIAAAAGAYISFLDSDDYWLPNRVALMVEALDVHHDWVAAFHDVKLISATGVPICGTYLSNANFLSSAQPYIKKHGEWFECNKEFFKFMSLRYGAVHTQSIIINRKFFTSRDLIFDETLTICEDTDLWIKIAMRGKLGFLNQVLSHYRQHSSSITRNTILFAEQTVNFHQKNYLQILSSLTQQEMQQYKKKIAACWRSLAYQYLQVNMNHKARKAYLQSFSNQASFIDLILFLKTFIPVKIFSLVRKLRSP